MRCYMRLGNVFISATFIISLLASCMHAQVQDQVQAQVQASEDVPMVLRQEEYQRYLQATDADNEESGFSITEQSGPWEKCLGMQAEDCVEYIESKASDVFCVVVYPKTGTSSFNYDRIWIRVNHDNLVVRTPSRG